MYARPKPIQMDTPTQMDTPAPPQHWHVWRVARTGCGAFMSRPYMVRVTAKKAAERWAGGHRRALTFVHECNLGRDCPRAPRIQLDA